MERIDETLNDSEVLRLVVQLHQGRNSEQSPTIIEVMEAIAWLTRYLQQAESAGRTDRKN